MYGICCIVVDQVLSCVCGICCIVVDQVLKCVVGMCCIVVDQVPRCVWYLLYCGRPGTEMCVVSVVLWNTRY